MSQTPLQRFLDEHDLTQTALADGVGMAVSQVNGIVRGHTRPRVDTVNRLLSFFRTVDSRVTYDDLFGNRETAA
jgi:transcriptional regulator with XRE-family HTH domain